METAKDLNFGSDEMQVVLRLSRKEMGKFP